MTVSSQASKMAVLEQENIELVRINNNLLISIDALSVDNEHLKHHLSILKQAIFGIKSEKMDLVMLKQLPFIFNEAESCASSEQEDVEVSADVIEAKDSNNKRGRRALPKDLPRQQVVYDIFEEERKCSCGCELTRIGEEKSEQLDYIPAKLQIIEHIRYKYACKSCEEKVVCAPVPVKPLPKANATSGLLSHVLVSKYSDHLPLYRQSLMFVRQDIDLSRATLCNWVNSCGHLLAPLVKLLREEIVGSDYVASDETPVKVLDNGKSKGYMWVHLSGVREKRAVVYDYHDSRSGECASEFLKGFKGYHQCDAYSGYDALHRNAGVSWVGCWAHARRKFIEITSTVKTPGIAHKALIYVAQLYKVEREAIDKVLDPCGVKELRTQKSEVVPFSQTVF